MPVLSDNRYQATRGRSPVRSFDLSTIPVRHHVWMFVCGLLALLLAGCNLTDSSQITPIPTPDIPQVEILAPANNRQVIEGVEFEIDIVARDDNPGIARVQLFIDGESINTVSPPESTAVPVFRVAMNWRAQGVGLHVIEVYAYRPDGTQGDPAVINIEVLPRE